jgi:hypothetical protein
VGWCKVQRMNFEDFGSSFQQMWENKPGVIVLLALGFVVFIFVVVDTWRHKRRHRRPH